jgi:hypothetical protein
MPQINLAGGPHGAATLNQGTDDEERYWPYAKGSRQLHLLQRAFFVIDHNLFKKKAHCNSYFRLLRSDGSSRSFDDVWQDSDIWISYEPRTNLGWDGTTNATDGKEISIGEDAFRTGNVWYVTGVLVQELAHTNEAGGPPSKAAATALKYCGLAWLYDGAVGVSPVLRRTPMNGSRKLLMPCS